MPTGSSARSSMPAGLTETKPDMPLKRGTPFARGHTGRILLGRRLVIPGDNPTQRDRRRRAASSAPPPTSRASSRSFRPTRARACSRRQPARDDAPALAQSAHPVSSSYYGLGTISGTLGGWDWFGHSRRPARLHLAHLRAIRSRSSRSACSPTRSTAGRIVWVDGIDAHPAGLRAQRRADAQDARLERALVEPVGAARSRADGQTRCWSPRPASSIR